MAKTTKARGLTNSVRTKRGGATETVAAVVAVVADPVTRTLEPVALEVPTGTARSIIEWIGSDTDRAEAVAARNDKRKSIRDAAAAVLGD